VTNLTTIDQDIAQSIVQGVDRLEQGIYRLLEKGQHSGEIPDNKDIKAITRLLVATSYGLNIAARINPD
jgi:TetR/AcrR family transcriptional regulator, transcriptional repressor for nem operon